MWYCYLLQSDRDSSYYTGITLSLADRITRHNSGTGAKRTRGRGPWRLVWAIGGMTHREAAQMEVTVKKLPRQDKADWCVRHQLGG